MSVRSKKDQHGMAAETLHQASQVPMAQVICSGHLSLSGSGKLKEGVAQLRCDVNHLRGCRVKTTGLFFKDKLGPFTYAVVSAGSETTSNRSTHADRQPSTT